MKSTKKTPEKSGIAFTLQESQAELSLAALFYFQKKMPDPALKVEFERKLLNSLVDHAATTVRHKDGRHGLGDYVSLKERANNYADRNSTCRLSWILTYAAKQICEETPDGEPNPFKEYYLPFAPYIFADPQQAVQFAHEKPKLVNVVRDESNFSLESLSPKNLFKPKSVAEKCKGQVTKEIGGFMMQDPFIDAIDHMFHANCLTTLQRSIDELVEKVEEPLEAYWKAKGLKMPNVKALEAA